MKVEVTSDPVLFRAWVFPFLERNPVLNSVLLTNVEKRADGLLVEAEPSFFVRVLDGSGEVVGAAMRTPGRAAFLGPLPDEAARPVADRFAELVPDLQAVFGAERAARLFAERWTTDLRVARASRLHRLGQPVEQSAPGSPRPAEAGDAELCAEWAIAFFGEVDEPAGDTSAWAVERIGTGALWLWLDGARPVSLVGHHVATFGVTRIGPVYTPPSFRGRGYASALTSHVSGLVRGRGEEACLVTDLANPTSNKIYAAVGYEPVADFMLYSFNSGNQQS